MGRHSLDLVGHVYGRLTVLRRVNSANERSTWECSCDCGNITRVAADSLRSSATLSCGCIPRGGWKHSLAHSPLYRIWAALLYKCEFKHAPEYPNFGGRGITLCDEWKDSPVAFTMWASANGYQEGLRLDRKDDNKGYTPDNCHFVTPKVRMHTKKMLSSNTSGYTGVSFCARWGVFYAYLSHERERVFLGKHYTAEDAVLTRDEYILKYDLPHKLQVLSRD